VVSAVASGVFAIQAGSGYGKRYFLSCAKQTTNLSSINSSQLKGFPALLPPLDEQKAIVDIISSADDQIAADQKILANLEKQKRGLMQDLLTGRVRCNVTGGAKAAG
jgi:type I restriction enzyme S subunit